MKYHRLRVLRLVIAALLALSCGGVSCTRRPVEMGVVDMQALGAGIGRELCAFLSPGDRVLVFGTPGAAGFAAQAQADARAGMNMTLSACRASAEPVVYTEEDVRAYHTRQSARLDADDAAPALARAGADRYTAVVALGVQPDPSIFSAGTVLVLIDWNPGAAAPAAEDLRAVIHVSAREASGLVLPRENLLRDAAAALTWFDQRFVVKVRTP